MIFQNMELNKEYRSNLTKIFIITILLLTLTGCFTYPVCDYPDYLFNKECK